MPKEKDLKSKVIAYVLSKEILFRQKSVATTLSVSEQTISTWVKDIGYRLKIDTIEKNTSSELWCVTNEVREKLKSLGYRKLDQDIMEHLFERN